MLLIKLQVVLLNITYLAKLQYFTNLDFPEIAGDFPSKTLPLGGPKTRVFGRELIWPGSFPQKMNKNLRKKGHIFFKRKRISFQPSIF